MLIFPNVICFSRERRSVDYFICFKFTRVSLIVTCVTCVTIVTRVTSLVQLKKETG